LYVFFRLFPPQNRYNNPVSHEGILTRFLLKVPLMKAYEANLAVFSDARDEQLAKTWETSRI